MKIKHKLTGDVATISRITWDEQYLPKKLNDVYDIIAQDIVLVREVKDDGTRIPYKKMDRPHAFAMVKKEPMKFDYIEINVDVPIENHIDTILHALYDSYPNQVAVYDYAERKLELSDREQQIIVDTLREQNLSKATDGGGNLMIITTRGREIIETGGYVIYKRKQKENNYMPTDKPSESEIEIINQKLDELLMKIEKLQVGQSVLYESLSDDIDEVKKLARVLGKKNLMEIIKGKFVQAGFGHLFDAVESMLVETFKDTNLLEG